LGPEAMMVDRNIRNFLTTVIDVVSADSLAYIVCAVAGRSRALAVSPSV
jgi:hypothetical protein